jgi:hypothetical protein
MTRRIAIAIFALCTAMVAPLAQSDLDLPETPAAETDRRANFDTSYRPSPTVSSRMQRDFLTKLRWSVGVEARDTLAAAFAERSPVEIWTDLVAADGLAPNNVADALAAYWVLNWVTANGAYSLEVDNAPVQRQLRIAFADDINFTRMGDQQRQELAEGYILDFLIEHAAVNRAVKERDAETLYKLASASIARFQQKFRVNLLAVEPGPNGFDARRTARRPAETNEPADN